jgi:hypothetical protein
MLFLKNRHVSERPVKPYRVDCLHLEKCIVVRLLMNCVRSRKNDCERPCSREEPRPPPARKRHPGTFLCEVMSNVIRKTTF